MTGSAKAARIPYRAVWIPGSPQDRASLTLRHPEMTAMGCVSIDTRSGKWNSLFRPKNSLFSQKNSLFFQAQGICLQPTEIAVRIDAESAEIAVFAGNFLKFPVKFPVLSSPPGLAGPSGHETRLYML